MADYIRARAIEEALRDAIPYLKNSGYEGAAERARAALSLPADAPHSHLDLEAQMRECPDHAECPTCCAITMLLSAPPVYNRSTGRHEVWNETMNRWEDAPPLVSPSTEALSQAFLLGKAAGVEAVIECIHNMGGIGPAMAADLRKSLAPAAPKEDDCG
jgi:hypothetical protein